MPGVKGSGGVADNRLKKFLRKFVRIAAWTAGSVLILLLVLIVVVRIPAVQQAIVDKATAYLEDRIGTPVSIGRLLITFPKKIEVEDFYLEDELGDTLVYAHKFEVDVGVLAIMKREIAIKEITLNTARVFVKRAKADTTFNYTYIVEAFTSGETDSVKVDEGDKKAWAISLDDVVIDKSFVGYFDKHGETEFTTYVGKLDISSKETNLIDNIYRLKKIELADAAISLSLMAAPGDEKPNENQNPEASDTTSKPFVVDLRELLLTNVTLHYNTPSEHAMVDFGKFEIESNDVSLTVQSVDLKQVTLENTTLSYFTNQKAAAQPKDTTEGPFQISPWQIDVDKVTLADNTIRYYDLTANKQNGFDPGRVWISALTGNFENISIGKTTASLSIDNFQLKERSGLIVRRLDGQFSLTGKEAIIRDFHGKVNRTELHLNASVKYSDINRIAEDLAKTTLDVQVGRSVLYAGDVVMLYPTLFDSLPFKVKPNDRITLSGGISGRVNDLSVRSLALDALDSTRLSVSGRVKGLPNIKASAFRLSVDELRTTRSDVKRVLADSLMPTGIVLPTWISLNGSFNGTYKNPSMDARLRSSDGTVTAKGQLNLSGKGSYDLLVEAQQLALGHILANKDLGSINVKAKAVGTGTTVDDIDARLNMLLSSLSYKGYNYKDLRLDGRLTRYLFSGNVIMDDENLDFTLKANVDYTPDVPTFALTLNMKNIDLKALKLTERPLRARATLDVDMATADFKSVNGRIDLRKVAVFNGAKLYAVDSLLVASIDQVGESSIDIRSDIMTGDFKGTINIFTLPTALKQHINRYFSLNDSTIEDPKDLQKFDFDLTLKNTELLTEVLFPPLEPFTPGKIYGSFNSEEQKLDLQIKLTNFAYDGASADSLSFIVNSDEQGLDYRFGVKEIKVDTLRIHDLTFAGTAANDTLSSSFRVLDSLNNETYLLGGVLTRVREALQLNLKKVVLNGASWDVPAKNALQFGASGLRAEDFRITKDNQQVALETSAKDSLVNIMFKELELGNLTRIISGAVPASGELNGELKFSTSNSGNFSSRLDITSLNVLHKTWGDVNLTLKHANERYDYDLKIRGNQTRVEANGNFAVVGDSSVVTLAVAVPSLNIELIEPFTRGQAKNMQGILVGNMKISGKLPALDVRGELSFRDATFEAPYLNSPFELKDETILFRDQGIVLNNFRILDRMKNAATIDGVIATKKYRDFDLDLKVNAKNFQVLNKPEAHDQAVYGLLKVDLDATVKGPSTHPAVQVRAGMSNDTNVTYVLPQSEAGVMEQEGIVTFVDKDAVNDPFLKEVKPTEGVAQGFRGVELNAIIELQGGEKLSVVIDPETGDKLTVQGRANLIFGIDPSGNMNLSGRYQVIDGKYHLSFYKLVKREFDIVKGGTITWSGDPLRGALDLSALYSVEAAPLELVSNQLTSNDESVVGPYRQHLPFLVYMNLSGEIMAPEIGFRLDMPEEKRNMFGGVVYGRIQDIDTKESELNKQVFGLLILRTFVAENPFEGSSGGDLQNSARVSASRMLSQQLNRLSSKIKGVELSMNVKSYQDYTSSAGGQGRTQAQLGVSKTLFGNRLVVRLSGNVDIEGESQQSNVTDYIGDLALEYKMTTDGRFRLTGFRNSNYDMIDGELIETGAGVIYIKDYNALRELFKANEKTE